MPLLDTFAQLAGSSGVRSFVTKFATLWRRKIRTIGLLASLIGVLMLTIGAGPRDDPFQPLEDSDIFVVSPDGTNRVNVTNHPSDDIVPAWSPDSKRIAFASDRDDGWTVYVMNRDGSDLRRLGEVDWGRPQGLSWSPDGTTLAINDGVGITLLSVADGTSQWFESPCEINGRVDWSPDGSRIAFAGRDCMGVPGVSEAFLVDNIYVVPLQGLLNNSFIYRYQDYRLSRFEYPLEANNPSWSSDGQSIRAHDGSQFVNISSRDGNWRWIPIGQVIPEDAASWAPDGGRVAVADLFRSSRPIVIIETVTGKRTTVTDGSYPAWSPDGSQIAFVAPGQSRVAALTGIPTPSPSEAGEWIQLAPFPEESELPRLHSTPHGAVTACVDDEDCDTYSDTDNAWHSGGASPRSPLESGAGVNRPPEPDAITVVDGDTWFAISDACPAPHPQRCLYRSATSSDTWVVISGLPTGMNDVETLAWSGQEYLYADDGVLWRYSLSSTSWERVELPSAQIKAGWMTANQTGVYLLTIPSVDASCPCRFFFSPFPSAVAPPELATGENRLQVQLQAHRTDVEVGEDVFVSLSVVNWKANPRANVELVLQFPSDWRVTGTGPHKAGSGGQYTTNLSLEPGELGDFALLAVPNGTGTFQLTGFARYSFAEDNTGEQIDLQSVTINVGTSAEEVEPEAADLVRDSDAARSNGGCNGPLGGNGPVDASWLLLGLIPGLVIVRKQVMG